ncbi:hypothetical protein ACTFIZ_008584 [Dictyostelium cf. discoideum]
MEDRLQELRIAGGLKPQIEKKNGRKGSMVEISLDTPSSSKIYDYKENGGGGGDIELEINDHPDPVEEFMPEFYQEVGIIKSLMTSVKKNIRAIEDKYILSLNSISIESQNQKYEDDIQLILEVTNSSLSELRNKLDLMKSSNEKYSFSKSSTPTEVRIRNSMLNTLTQKFIEMMREYQEIQNNYKNKYKEKIERQYKIVKPEATTQEINDAIQSGDSKKIFEETILHTHLHNQALNALDYIQERHNDIIKLEQSIKELHQLFLDMAVLVHNQGELLNVIEDNINSAVSDTREGTQNLQEANKLHKKSRKKMYILLIIVSIVLVIILVPILSTQINK